MFATKDINKFFDIDIAMSNDMVDSIDLWNKILENKQPWLDNEKGVKSLALAQGIGEELSKTSTRELISKVISNDFVNQEYQEFIKDMNENLQWALGEGGVVFKPYVSDNQIFVDIVHADKFFPVTFNGRKKISAGIFVEQIFKGKNVYTRLEYQKYEKLVLNDEKLKQLEKELKVLQKKIVNQKAKQDDRVTKTIQEYQEKKAYYENHPLVVNYLYLQNEVNEILQTINQQMNNALK